MSARATACPAPLTAAPATQSSIPQNEHSRIQRSTALDLFGLREFADFREESTDSVAVMGWSDTTVVLSFKGTSSKKNMQTNVRFGQIRMEPETSYYGKLARVHKGERC